jgi:hypothetical protein
MLTSAIGWLRKVFAFSLTGVLPRLGLFLFTLKLVEKMLLNMVFVAEWISKNIVD